MAGRSTPVFHDYVSVYDSEYDVRNVRHFNIPRTRADIGFKICDIKGARKWNQYYEITNKYLCEKVPKTDR